MGIFNFLKNKKEPAGEYTLFTLMNTYAEYINLFIGMQQQGNYAPISAYQKQNGELTGYLFVNGEETYTLSAGEAVERMKSDLTAKLNNGEIISYTILYHSQFQNDDNHHLATADEELKAISIVYGSAQNLYGAIGLPYHFEEESVRYQGFPMFTQEENNILFSAKLKDGKDYFQERVEIKSEIIQNEAGLNIKKTNIADLSNTWCGIFGFDHYRNKDGHTILTQHFTWLLTQPPILVKEDLKIFAARFGAIQFKVICVNDHPVTIMPVVETGSYTDVENKEINEWEHVQNTEAIITGGGRDTFGIKYFATDYAEHRQRYLSTKKLDIRLSGIIYVLDLYTGSASDTKTTFSEDFSAYMPNKEMESSACFDFVGILEDFRETVVFDDGSLTGYILSIRLINNPDIKDFFTIDMYVTAENMRFAPPFEKGMHLTGMFQLQGQIRS